MKILLSDQIRELDACTIKEEPVSSIDLMERASSSAAEWISNASNDKKPILIFCGPGNNGGDGLAIARILHTKGYNIQAYLIESKQYSSDCLINQDRMRQIAEIIMINAENIHSADIPANAIVVDAIFGSGLNRPLEGIYADLVEKINKSGATIASIDIPSGLSADGLPISGVSIEADYTLSFQLPKLAFFLPSNEKYVGRWNLLDIGLNQQFIRETPTNYYYTSLEDVLPLVKSRPVFAHKGTFGKALIIAGNFGSIGAAVLATEACYRSGAGLVTAYTPGCGNSIIQSSVPEALSITDPDFNEITEFPDTKGYNAIGIGPGISEGPKTEHALKNFLDQCTIPVVLDASALNMISRSKDLLQLIPPGSILTPHPKEFQRLAGPWSNDPERLELQRKLAEQTSSIIIVKGAYTAICDPSGNIHFNSTGNAGMATGGSGDVLTGLITGLMAQGYQPLDAAIFGVYIHGYAGDKAAAERSQQGMIAGDIIRHLGDFYRDHFTSPHK